MFFPVFIITVFVFRFLLISSIGLGIGGRMFLDLIVSHDVIC